MDEQKDVEAASRKIKQLEGNAEYWKQMAGKYRQANHENLKKIKTYKALTFFLILFFVIDVVMFVAGLAGMIA